MLHWLDNLRKFIFLIDLIYDIAFKKKQSSIIYTLVCGLTYLRIILFLSRLQRGHKFIISKLVEGRRHKFLMNFNLRYL